MIRRLVKVGYPGQGLKANVEGVAAIEFGIIAPVLGLLLLGMVDLSRAFSAQFELQAALSRTMEMAQIGSFSDDFSYLTTEAQAAADVPAANILLTQWTECGASTTRLTYTATCTTGQQTARYVQLDIAKNFTPTFGMQIFHSATNGTVPLTVSQVLRVQ